MRNVEYLYLRLKDIDPGDIIVPNLIPIDRIPRYCDACIPYIPKSNIHYRFEICNQGDHEIYMECYELDRRCLNHIHDMIQIKMVMV